MTDLRARAEVAEAEVAALAKANFALAKQIDTYQQCIRTLEAEKASDARVALALIDTLKERRDTARARAEAAEADVEELRTENFALSANQCEGGYGDECGNHQCTVVDAANAQVAAIMAERDQLAARVTALEGALEQLHEMLRHSPTAIAGMACDAIQIALVAAGRPDALRTKEGL